MPRRNGNGRERPRPVVPKRRVVITEVGPSRETLINQRIEELRRENNIWAYAGTPSWITSRAIRSVDDEIRDARPSGGTSAGPPRPTSARERKAKQNAAKAAGKKPRRTAAPSPKKGRRT